MLAPELPTRILYRYFLFSDDSTSASLRRLNKAWKEKIDKVAQIWLHNIFTNRGVYPYESNTANVYENGYKRFYQLRLFINQRLNYLGLGGFQSEVNAWQQRYNSTKHVLTVRDLFFWIKDLALIEVYESLSNPRPALPHDTVQNASNDAWEILSKNARKLVRNKYISLNIPLFPVDLAHQAFATFDFKRCFIEFIPPRLGTVTELTRIDFRDNFIASLPLQLSKLTRLRTCRLSGNRFEEIPACLFGLPNLTKLDLEDNKIKVIPSNMSRLTSLTTLNLKANEIHYIAGTLLLLTSLTKLDCEMNPLDRMSKTLYKWKLNEIEEDKHQSPLESPEERVVISCVGTT